MPRIDGRYAVVTGGGKGIGRAIVTRFLAEGAQGIAILDYDIETALKTAAELDSEKIMAVRCDVSSPEQVEEAFKKVFERFPVIDILINNAGLTRDAMLHKMTFDQWDTVLNADLKGIFACIKQVVPGMRERGYGKIVNIASTSARGNIGQANYSAAKAGILGLTATAALELAPKNITVNAVAPGLIDTDILKTVPDKILEDWIGRSPIRRKGKPEEIAAVVYFFSNDDSSYTTGQTIYVCGGTHITF